MRMYDIIQKKKTGWPLTKEEIDSFITGYTHGEIPDYQASAFCMATCFQGMTPEETYLLTDAMMHSGDTVDLSEFGDLTVDKHSTGGVGDKVSLIVGPIVSSLGCVFAKMSGRGLGHTGGTVDKLESIPGYRTELSKDEILDVVRNCGMAIVGSSADLAPADKKLYALRDVTATVDCIPLIASSIMSKKLAAGSHNIILDVKTGSGAFMKTVEDAKALANAMVEIGTLAGRNVRACVTNMDRPLGHMVGNSLEVKEAIAVLKGESKEDLYEVCVTLASNLVSMSLKLDMENAHKLVTEAVDSGRALEQMKKWISAQGGNAQVVDDANILPQSVVQYELKSTQSGYIAHMDAERIGMSASQMGAGRVKKEDKIDMAAGIEVCVKTGDFVKVGDTLAVFHAESMDKCLEGAKLYFSALTWSEEPVELLPLIFS